MDWTSHTRGATALAAMALIIGCGVGDDPPPQEDATTEAPATTAEALATTAEAPATGWWVDLDVDHAADTMGNAWSPVSPAPEALADADGDFSSTIRYLCLNAYERELGNVAPIMIRFQVAPRLVAREGGEVGELGQIPVLLQTNWGEETVAMSAYAGRSCVALDQEDSAGRGTGESSHAEFLRRLVESNSTASDAVVVEMDWQDVGPVSYAFSLEGAAAAIQEAGLPCGVG